MKLSYDERCLLISQRAKKTDAYAGLKKDAETANKKHGSLCKDYEKICTRVEELDKKRGEIHSKIHDVATKSGNISFNYDEFKFIVGGQARAGVRSGIGRELDLMLITARLKSKGDISKEIQVFISGK